MVKIVVPVFYALHDTRTPVKIAFMSLFINAILDYVLIGPLQSGGLALAPTSQPCELRRESEQQRGLEHRGDLTKTTGRVAAD